MKIKDYAQISTSLKTRSLQDEIYLSIKIGNGVTSFRGEYSIKYALMFILFFSFFNKKVFSQTNTNDLEFANLETPTSPGLILFDETPRLSLLK